MEEFLGKVGYRRFCDYVKSKGWSLDKVGVKNDEEYANIYSSISKDNIHIILDENVKYKVVKEKLSIYKSRIPEYQHFIDLCQARVISYDKSVRLFKHKDVKKQMSEIIIKPYADGTGQSEIVQYFRIVDILPEYKSKGEDGNNDVIVLKHEDKHYKFVLEDLEITYPDIDNIMKGYNLPKDRKVGKGSIVKVFDKKSKLELGEIGKVTSRVSISPNKVFYNVLSKGETYIINQSKLKVIDNVNKKDFKEEVRKESRFKAPAIRRRSYTEQAIRAAEERERSIWTTVPRGYTQISAEEIRHAFEQIASAGSRDSQDNSF